VVYSQTIVLDNNGLGLVGVFYEPAGPNAPAPAVLMLHDLEDSPSETGLFQRMALELASAGLAAFALHFRGTGESEGKGVPKSPRDLVSDALCAAAFLASHPMVDANRLHGLGVGVGAAVSASLACSEPRFRSLALLTPAYSAEPVLRRARRSPVPFLPSGRPGPALGLTAGFAEEWNEQGFTRSYHELRVPVLLVHGNRDRVVPVSQSQLARSALEKSGQTVKFVSIEGCDHWFSLEDWQRLAIREVCQWFSEAPDGVRAVFA